MDYSWRLLIGLNAWLAALFVFVGIVGFAAGYITLKVMRFESMAGWRRWFDVYSPHIFAIYHELAHAVVGLPFLLIPFRINVKRDSAGYSGYVKQLAIFGLPFL